jgi:hypothetical protein
MTDEIPDYLPPLPPMMKFKAVIEDPWLSQKYEFEIESKAIAPVAISAAEKALATEEEKNSVSKEYLQAINQKRRDMVIASIKLKTTVMLVR